VSEEVLKMAFDVRLLLLVHQSIDCLTSSVSIRPFFHFERLFKLEVSQLEQLDDGLIVRQSHWVRDLVVVRIDRLVGLLDLKEMCMQHVRQTHVLLATIELLSELEEADGHLVVEVQKPAILPDHIKDDLADLDEEHDLWQYAVLLLKLVQITVRQQDQLLG
jgi:hypothetical protein